jgi:hypothetical protein
MGMFTKTTSADWGIIILALIVSLLGGFWARSVIEGIFMFVLYVAVFYAIYWVYKSITTYKG